MGKGLLEAGDELAAVYDPDPAKVAHFLKTFPGAAAVSAKEAILSVAGQGGFPFFGALILDCLHRTAKAYSREMFFKAPELAIIAEQSATRID